MRKILLFFGILLICFSCKKEKFGKEYIGEFKGSVEIEGITYDYLHKDIPISLTNETKKNITLNGSQLTKSGREIYGVLPSGAIYIQTDSLNIGLKKNLLNDVIVGTFTTNIYKMPGTPWGLYPTEGNITMTKIE